MKTFTAKLKKQRGISLFEMAIAAAVIAALLVGVLIGLPKLQLERQLTAARKEIPLTINTITMAYATQLNTNGANVQLLSNFNAWPSDRVKNRGTNTATVTGPFPGSSELVFTSGNTSPPRLTEANQGFAYWLHNIPPEACMPLLQILVSQRPVAQVFASNQPITQPSGSTRNLATVGALNSNGTLSLNLGAASNVCGGASNKSIMALLSRS